MELGVWKKILCLGNINSNRIRSRDDNNNVMKVVTKIVPNVIEIILDDTWIHFR